MGKSYQGIHGNYLGKVGNVVARQKDNRVILSIYVPHPANPRTTKQTTVRAKFGILSQFASHFEGWAKVMCKGVYQYGTYYSNLLKMNPMADVITGTYPSFTILFNKYKMSKGALEQVESPSAVYDSQIMSVSWNDNSGMENAEATDQACIIVFNSVKNQAIYNLSAGARSTRQGTVTIPTAWSGDSVDVWMSVRSTTNEMVSDSVYLGNFGV